VKDAMKAISKQEDGGWGAVFTVRDTDAYAHTLPVTFSLLSTVRHVTPRSPALP